MIFDFKKDFGKIEGLLEGFEHEMVGKEGKKFGPRMTGMKERWVNPYWWFSNQMIFKCFLKLFSKFIQQR